MSRADAVVSYDPEAEASKAIKKIYENLKKEL
jgi:hypothetical protein